MGERTEILIDEEANGIEWMKKVMDKRVCVNEFQQGTGVYSTFWSTLSEQYNTILRSL